VRWIAGAGRLETVGKALDGVTVWLLVAFGFGVMDGVGARLMADPAWVLEATLAACATAAGLNLATTAALLPFGSRVAATAGMLSGFRSMALYLAVLPAAADPRVALFFGLYQIPLYVGPLVMAPACRWLLRDRRGFAKSNRRGGIRPAPYARSCPGLPPLAAVGGARRNPAPGL
jgi:hypothetical protein